MPTRKTFYWLIATAVIYLISLNIGSGWLYVVTAFMVALPAAGLILARLNGGRVRIRQSSGDTAVSGGGISARVELSNPSIIPRFLLRLDLDLGGAAASCLVPYLGARSSCTVEADFSGLKRGIYPGGRVVVSSTAPNGFFRVRRRLDTECPLVVYPHRQRLGGDWAGGSGSSGYMADSVVPARSSGSDYLGVRDYRPGDSPRSIHWRTSARAGRLAVIEYARQMAMTPVFILDLYGGAVAGQGDAGTLETAITITASLVEREARQGRRFGLGASPADAAGKDLSAAEEPALLWLAGAQAGATRPLDLAHAELPWPEATPVIVLTSHRDYGKMHQSGLIANYPHSIVIMLNGRGFATGLESVGRFLSSAEIDLLASGLEDAGGRFLEVDSPRNTVSCLASL